MPEMIMTQVRDGGGWEKGGGGLEGGVGVAEEINKGEVIKASACRTRRQRTFHTEPHHFTINTLQA